MNNIGIISGGGNLPIAIGKSLIKKNFKVIFFVIEEFYKKDTYGNFEVKVINLNSVKKILKLLKSNDVESIVMAGNINRPSLKDLSFDLQTFKLAKNLLINKTGDNDLLVSIKKFFNENGFKYFNWRDHCIDLFANEINLTSNKPSKLAMKNLDKALSIFKNYGKLDLGQSMIIQNQIILGLEAVEGTDNLIKRCNALKKKGDKGILVKLSKYNQSDIIDIPTIGLETIRLLKEYNYEGVYLETSNCIILDKQKTINFANQNNLFISNCHKIEQK